MGDPVLSPVLRSRINNMSPTTFWAMVFIIWILSFMPYVNLPFAFLATWIHEVGHGVGARVTGGGFDSFIVNSDFSGLAQIRTSSDFQHVSSLLAGLLGPTILGGLMILGIKGLRLGRIMLGLLAVLLLLSAIFWAGNFFTRAVVIIMGVGLGGIAGFADEFMAVLVSYIVAVALCLNAISHVTYYFVSQGQVSDQTYMSDTALLSEIVGGPQLLWAIGLSVLSFAILYMFFRLSGLIRKAG